AHLLAPPEALYRDLFGRGEPGPEDGLPEVTVKLLSLVRTRLQSVVDGLDCARGDVGRLSHLHLPPSLLHQPRDVVPVLGGQQPRRVRLDRYLARRVIEEVVGGARFDGKGLVEDGPNVLLWLPYRLLGPGDDPLLDRVDDLGDDVVVLVEIPRVLSVERDPRPFVLDPGDLSFRWDTVEYRTHETDLTCLLCQRLTAIRELSQELVLVLLRDLSETRLVNYGNVEVVSREYVPPHGRD